MAVVANPAYFAIRSSRGRIFTAYQLNQEMQLPDQLGLDASIELGVEYSSVGEPVIDDCRDSLVFAALGYQNDIPFEY